MRFSLDSLNPFRRSQEREQQLVKLRKANVEKTNQVASLIAKNKQLLNELVTPYPFVDRPGRADIQLPGTPLDYEYLYWAYEHEVMLRTCIDNIVSEVFRQGLEWRDKYACKCPSCGREYEHEVEVCDCGAKTIEPNGAQLNKGKAFLRKNDVMHALRLFLHDYLITDDAYLVFIQDYVLDERGNVTRARLRDVAASRPTTMKKIGDGKNKLGGKYYICLKHRDEPQTAPGNCPSCGNVLHDVHYINDIGEQSKAYYIEGEVVHRSLWPGFYGYSRIITLWTYICILHNMDEYVRAYYGDSKVPKGVIVLPTRNLDSVDKTVKLWEKKKKEDPAYVPMLGIDPGTDGKSAVGFVRFMDTLAEMGYTEAKKDYRERMSALYGTTNLFMADNSSAGGLHNDTQQIVVQDRTVQGNQAVINELLEIVMGKLGITDYELVLKHDDNVARMSDLEVEAKTVAIAKMMADLGFEIKRDEHGKFIYSDEPKPKEEKPEEPKGEKKADNPLESDDVRITFEKATWSEAIVQALQAGALWTSYPDLDQITIMKIVGFLSRMFLGGNWSIRQQVKPFALATGIPEIRAEGILRNESHVVVCKARELFWRESDPEGKYKYTWSITRDDRTSDECKEVRARIDAEGGAVPLDRLKTIIREVFAEYSPKQIPRDFVAHIGACRSVIVRRVT